MLMPPCFIHKIKYCIVRMDYKMTTNVSYTEHLPAKRIGKGYLQIVAPLPIAVKPNNSASSIKVNVVSAI